MKIIMGSAVKGLTLKNTIKKHLESKGHEIIDVGCYSNEKFIKYTSVAERVAKAIQDGRGELAIFCCGSGTGSSMSVGKFKGVLACSCESVQTAKLARMVNDANCLSMGESIVDGTLGCEMADVFVNTKFQDAKGIPSDVLEFWLEARDEMKGRGDNSKDRELESIGS
jgi:ribose 5-phosphate isomerase B